MCNWTVEFVNAMAEQEFLAQPPDIKARFMRIARLIEQHGLEHLGMLRHLEGKLWEMRAKEV